MERYRKSLIKVLGLFRNLSGLGTNLFQMPHISWGGKKRKRNLFWSVHWSTDFYYRYTMDQSLFTPGKVHELPDTGDTLSSYSDRKLWRDIPQRCYSTDRTMRKKTVKEPVKS